MGAIVTLDESNEPKTKVKLDKTVPTTRSSVNLDLADRHILIPTENTYRCLTLLLGRNYYESGKVVVEDVNRLTSATDLSFGVGFLSRHNYDEIYITRQVDGYLARDKDGFRVGNKSDQNYIFCHLTPEEYTRLHANFTSLERTANKKGISEGIEILLSNSDFRLANGEIPGFKINLVGILQKQLFKFFDKFPDRFGLYELLEKINPVKYKSS